jgi:levanase/fructan beta-fructosidase
VHLTAGRGWLNDPNGLCLVDGRWHAFFQHDPDVDVHGRMHWGHASSADLLAWDAHPVALAPDELGEIYSGSVVIDEDDSAGFGAGALVAVYTQHLDGLQRQSIASSLDLGATWTPNPGNPVLVSDHQDFRDPKVFRDPDTGDWSMVISAGRSVECYRSRDLRDWALTGTVECEVPGIRFVECPDLVRLGPGRDDRLLIFSAIGADDVLLAGTYATRGSFEDGAFEPAGEPFRLDHGPDHYAAQTFAGTNRAIEMAWMSNWRYAKEVPSDGSRGVLSFPRRITLDDRVVRSRPAVDLDRWSVPIERARWTAGPGVAVTVTGRDLEVVVDASDGTTIATVTIDDEAVRLDRRQDVAPGFAGTFRAELPDEGEHLVVIDHGTIEVFAAGGAVTMSALCFPGREWSVAASGEARLAAVRPGAPSSGRRT